MHVERMQACALLLKFAFAEQGRILSFLTHRALTNASLTTLHYCVYEARPSDVPTLSRLAGNAEMHHLAHDKQARTPQRPTHIVSL
jgi:hypothetical protein